MKTYMIHELNSNVLQALRLVVKAGDILTFDDGLYSHFLYWSQIKKIFSNNKKIFFISTGAVRKESPYKEEISCEEAMRRWIDGDKSAYMSWDEIKQIYLEGGEIGSHGHGHYYSFGENLAQSVKNFQKDIEEMYVHFEEHLGFRPKYYCRPYNKKQPVEKPILGDVIIYGDERIDIRNIMGVPGYESVFRDYKTFA